ncbi:MAG: hypothetical protein CME70_08890 [Halobacteriovorax sp.]|nr:hypothetical protein [Halobacteriovorax sp.]|tara:strand:+ start:67897 stop:68892 length:996 start_codon:yes stop_codon:yes gene_type:complete
MDIKSLINANYRDVSSVLSKKANWMEMDFLDKKTLNYTRPHSEECFNPLGIDSFLFHFKKKDWFNFFPSLFVRDGLLSILHFFYVHPKPDGIKTILILPDTAGSFIPSEWQEQCLLYKIQTHPLKEEVNRSELYLTTTVAAELYNDSNLKQQLDLAQKSQMSLKGLFFRHEPLGEEAVDTNDNRDFEFFNYLKNTIENNLELLDWRSLKSKDLSKVSFLELNENNYWYNDSAVTHHFLSNGASSFDHRYKAETFNEDDCVRISKYHYYKFKTISKEQKKNAESCWKYINEIPSHVFKEEALLDRKAQDYKEIFLCTPEFKSLAKDLINESF